MHDLELPQSPAFHLPGADVTDVSLVYVGPGLEPKVFCVLGKGSDLSTFLGLRLLVCFPNAAEQT